LNKQVINFDKPSTDSKGALKPSHRPFSIEGVTFDYEGKTIKIKKPKLSRPEKSDIHERVKVMK
jgi:hypothetical protein